ncbi:hypothetical protein F2Q68_00034400 [Brassica cretica]|uniref:Uncharacterized protein n=2 Tax=Brassica cretica TaxID=69181 RepID=A0A3N6TCN9_BRACR|nr:hypothetical protein F2Q68_00034400 [Brassica cretica]KAF3490433.1 hypothetical protein F2Q69_00053193 [Brassica cretica]KAF3596264.1 hypothetical protein DY000_02022209 [Brassica cretica]
MNPDDTPADGNRPSASVTPASEAPAAPNPSVPEMLQAIMARFIFIQQEEINKATSDRLAALAAALGTLDGKNDREETARRNALHDSKNFIKMDEDRRAYNAKQQALKTTASKTSDAQEPRQHAPYRRKGPIYAISKDDQSGAVTAVREPGWNVWERGTEGKTQLSRKAASANPKSSYDQKKFCKYHDMNGHDTKECRHLYEAWLASTSDGRTEPEPSKPKTIKNSKSWSKSKDKKKKSNEKKEEDSPPADEGDQSRPDEESTSDEEKPKSRRKILTIRAMPSPAPSITAKPEDDLCQSSYQKSAQTIESLTSTDSTLMEIDGTPTKIIHSVGKLNASDARYILDAKRKDPLH